MDSIRALTSGLIDYAGLFPPAELGMRAALEQYAGYVSGPDSRMLGRFIVPAARLDELEASAKGLLRSGRGSAPWRISALVGGDLKAEIGRLLKFNCAHWEESGTGHTVVDAVEIKAATADDIANAAIVVPDVFTTYYEIGLDGELDRAIARVKQAGARAKIRTGGVTAAAFPPAREVLRFMKACLGAGVAFKATAGLHHPVRSAYPYTYRRDSERGMMFGFLNVFLGAALLRAGADDDAVLRLLQETDAATFSFTGSGVEWRGHVLTTAELAGTRESFAISFGSCSFREPVGELKQLIAAAELA